MGRKIGIPPKWEATLYWLVPALLAIAAYAGTFWAPFVYDDIHIISNNVYLQNLSQPFSLFLKPAWYGIEGHVDGRYYRPTMMAWFWMIWHLVSHSPMAFHVFNVLLHACTTALVAVLGFRLLGRRDAALVAALIFSMHSVHSEPVAWIAASGDILAALFIGLAYYLSLSTGKKSVIGACTCLFFALCAKEIALMIGAVRVLELYLQGKKRESVRAGLIIGAVFAVYVGLRLVATSGFPRGAPLNVFSRWYFFEIFSRFLGMLVIPIQFDLHHGPEFLVVPGWPRVLPYLFVCLAYAGLMWLAYRRRWEKVTFGTLWIAMSLIPACNLIPIPLPLGERSTYVASMAACWLMGLLLVQRKWLVYGALAFLMPLYAFQLGQRLPDWCDPVKLWSASVEHHPTNFEPLHGLAIQMMQQGDYRHAVALYTRMWQVEKSEPITLELARSLMGQKRFKEALQVLSTISARSAEAADLTALCLFKVGAREQAIGIWKSLPSGGDISRRSLGPRARALMDPSLGSIAP